MKKHFAIIMVVLLVFVLFWNKSIKKFIPLTPPNITITYNQSKIEIARSTYTWCDKDSVGSSNLTADPMDLAKNLKATSVKKGEEIKFTFNTLWKQPNKITVNLVIPGAGLKEEAVNKDFFNAPKEKGEYIFLISGWWDEGHSIDYVFKINVT